jgi:hypothetical protein
MVFGMNFQAVSVGQKLIEKGVFGGYTNAEGEPTPSMLGQIEFVDAAIGQMVSALKEQDLLHATAIIITAKHGQSSIDPNRFFPIPGHSGANGAPPSQILRLFCRWRKRPGWGRLKMTSRNCGLPIRATR